MAVQENEPIITVECNIPLEWKSRQTVVETLTKMFENISTPMTDKITFTVTFSKPNIPQITQKTQVPQLKKVVNPCVCHNFHPTYITTTRTLPYIKLDNSWRNERFKNGKRIVPKKGALLAPREVIYSDDYSDACTTPLCRLHYLQPWEPTCLRCRNVIKMLDAEIDEYMA